jgi:hypothetical protein
MYRNLSNYLDQKLLEPLFGTVPAVYKGEIKEIFNTGSHDYVRVRFFNGKDLTNNENSDDFVKGVGVVLDSKFAGKISSRYPDGKIPLVHVFGEKQKLFGKKINSFPTGVNAIEILGGDRYTSVDSELIVGENSI